jgi:hypothetical protein
MEQLKQARQARSEDTSDEEEEEEGREERLATVVGELDWYDLERGDQEVSWKLPTSVGVGPF